MTVQNLQRIYQSHSSPEFLAKIADPLGSSEVEILEIFGAIIVQ